MIRSRRYAASLHDLLVTCKNFTSTPTPSRPYLLLSYCYYRMEETLLSRHSLSDITPEDDLKSSSRRSSNSAVRRSFFRRKRHQRNNSKDSREFNSYSDVSINSDSLSYLDGMSPYVILFMFSVVSHHDQHYIYLI